MLKTVAIFLAKESVWEKASMLALEWARRQEEDEWMIFSYLKQPMYY